MSAARPAKLTTSTFNRLSQCAGSPGSRAHYYAGVAVSSQRWPKPLPVLIAPTEEKSR